MATMSNDCTVEGGFFKPKAGKKQPYEVFFPGQFTQCQPWGSTPHDEWDERVKFCRDLRKAQEMVAKIGPLSCHSLSHVTHSQEAQEIHAGTHYGHYAFAPQQKFGKPYHPGSYTCLTPFRAQNDFVDQPKYKKIPETETVLPGLYSWWGIEVSNRPQISDSENVELADYLSYPPESRYGSHQFTIGLIDLLGSYARSRSCPVESVCFKVGGTLRYKQEICYVIIICLESDRGLEIFPNAHPNALPMAILHFITEDGKLSNKTPALEFYPQYVIKSCKVQGWWESFSWEVPVFAFHFPIPVLECPEKSITCIGVHHHDSFCIAKKKYYNPSGTYYHLKCPDADRSPDADRR